MLLQVILNIMYGSRILVPLGGVMDDSKHHIWLRNLSAIG